MFVRRPSFQFATSSSASSVTSLVKPPSVFNEDWDADDEETMSHRDYLPSRPLSLAIPNNFPPTTYALRRPTLREILANTSPSPWTLAAFMAYLSHNHCLETLEFIMDAGRYKKHFAKMMSHAASDALPPLKDRDYVQNLWHRLVDAYIRPNGSREVNLPSHVRDPILNLPATSALPPAPTTLDAAVTTIFELMEESVLVPFLNSMHPQSAYSAMSSCSCRTSEDGLSVATADDHDAYRRTYQSQYSSPTSRTSVEAHFPKLATTLRRSNQAAPLSNPSPTKSRFSVKSTPAPSISHGIHSSPYSTPLSYDLDLVNQSLVSARGPDMTDDNESSSSPSNSSPLTPPTSPPTCDLPGNGLKREPSMWRKFGRLSGLKSSGRKKASSGALEER